jgi:hypothetical protein
MNQTCRARLGQPSSSADGAAFFEPKATPLPPARGFSAGARPPWEKSLKTTLDAENRPAQSSLREPPDTRFCLPAKMFLKYYCRLN